MRTIADRLREGDVLADGSRVVSKTPTDHDTYVSIVVRHANGEVRIRDWDKGHSLDVGRPLANPFASPPVSPLEEQHARDAVDRYEHDVLGL